MYTKNTYSGPIFVVFFYSYQYTYSGHIFCCCFFYSYQYRSQNIFLFSLLISMEQYEYLVKKIFYNKLTQYLISKSIHHEK